MIVKQHEADRIFEYESSLQQTTLKTFKDRPDEVKSLTLLKSKPTELQFRWEPPNSNNSNITGYRIYLDDKLINKCADCAVTINALQPDTCYRIKVSAMSED